jgi:ABC-type Fe3+ transport system permease subunit
MSGASLHLAVLVAVAVAGVWFGHRRIREAAHEAARQRNWRWRLFAAAVWIPAAVVVAVLVVWGLWVRSG